MYLVFNERGMLPPELAVHVIVNKIAMQAGNAEQ
jgi:hypothetical protein